MAESKYTAPNDFRAFAESLGETEASLCHHGIKGQRWGVRRFQDTDGRLTSEGRKRYGYGPARKDGKEEDPKSKTSNMDKKLEELESRYQFNKPYTARDPLVRAAIKATLEFDKERTHGLHQGETEERQRARDDTKSAIALAYGVGIGTGALYGTGVGAAAGAVGIGTGIGAAAGAAAGTYLSIPAMANYASKAISARHANNKMEKQIKEIQNNTNVDKKSGVKLKNKEMTADEDMEYVNPGFKNWSDNTKNNCLLCSNAYALRRKGYDVMANGASDGYMGQIFTHFYPDAQMRRVKLPSYISKNTLPELVNALGIPDGGYGALSVTWKGDQGGHSMIYAVENGKPVLRDCQSNKIYRGVKVRQTLENTTKDVRITRLDNVEPDLKAMINANAINPGGQNFKPIKTEAEKAYESYKSKPATDTAKKHGEGFGFREVEKHFDEEKITNTKQKPAILDVKPEKERSMSELSDSVYDIFSNLTRDSGRHGDTGSFSKGNKGKTSAEVNMRNVKQPSKQDLKKQAQNLVDFYMDDLYSNKQVKNMARSLKVESVSNGKIVYTVKDPYGTIQKFEQPYTVGKNGQIIPKNKLDFKLK